MTHSSGGPVFNTDWNLIVIHHSGAFDMEKLDRSGTYEASEGIQRRSIKKALPT